MSYSIFLSHVGVDKHFVSAVADELSTSGLRAFMAQRDIPGSSEWVRSLEEALLQCDALVAFLQPSFRDSEWTDQEVGYALGRRKKVLPLRFDPTVVPHGYMARFQPTDIGGLEPYLVAEIILDLLFEFADERSQLVEVTADCMASELRELILGRWIDRLSKYQLDQFQQERLSARCSENPVIRSNGRLMGKVQMIVSAAAS